VSVDTRGCPSCGQPLVHVGKFAVCPEHGAISAPEPTDRLRIFLSYGHDSNEELVRLIKAGLEERGHDVWFDKSEIKAGDDWRREITDGINNSHRVVSFLSKHSMRDPGVCRDEIAIAIGVKGGNIQTVLVEAELDVEPPVNIGHIQWLDMHDWKERKLAEAEIWSDWYQSKFDDIVRVVESDESRRFAGEIERLGERLKPIKADPRIYDLLKKGYFGRAWLFDALDEWVRTRGTSRLLWITGDAGVGKSAFAAQLAHTRPEVIAAQFIEWDKPDHRKPRRVICSIAFQLATRLPDYRKLLLTLPEIDHLDQKDESELFDYLLVSPLRTAIGGGRAPHLIVIDALDEGGDSARNPLAEMLARHASRLPDWLGMVITSRPESSIITALQALDPVVLDTQTDANRGDLRDYLWHRLGIWLESRADADHLVTTIIDKSEGNFLYIERFCDDARNNRLSLNRPDEFPHGLGGIFYQFLQRQFPDLALYRESFRPALRTILASREALPLDVLQSTFGWSGEEVRDFTRPLGSLFPVTRNGTGEIIRPYHKALADWLSDATTAGEYFVDTREGHLRLVKNCIRVLAEQPSYDAAVNDSRARNDYRARNLIHHLLMLGDWDSLVACLSDTRIFDNLCPSTYGHQSGNTFITGERPDSFMVTPELLNTLPESRRHDIPWALAQAFATHAGRLMSRAFETATHHGEASNTLKRYFERERTRSEEADKARLAYSELVYGYADLSRLAPQFALSPCQFEEVAVTGGEHDGKVVLQTTDAHFFEKARKLLEDFKAVRLYTHYLATWAPTEGWSLQLPEIVADDADAAWCRLATAAYTGKTYLPGTAVHMPSEEATMIAAPWGMLRKDAGDNALLVKETDVDGTDHFYFVFTGPDGQPDAAPWALQRSGWV
jgi:TIR domain